MGDPRTGGPSVTLSRGARSRVAGTTGTLVALVLWLPLFVTVLAGDHLAGAPVQWWLVALVVLVVLRALVEGSWTYTVDGRGVAGGPFALPLVRHHAGGYTHARVGQVNFFWCRPGTFTGVVLVAPDGTECALRFSAFLGPHHRDEWVATITDHLDPAGDHDGPAVP